MDINGKKILIVGFGKSGEAAARYALANGAEVTVTDSRPAKEFESVKLVGLKTFFGSHPDHLFEENDVVVVSPGVPLNLPVLQKARGKGIPVIGEMELAEFNAKIIAITGTNGKSTVTTLIGEFLKAEGKNVLVGGNLGTPLLDLLATSHESQVTDFIVLEVSSYQLEISPSFHPNIALLLNITPDHLDRYENYEAYANAKGLVTKNQNGKDYFIYNEDDRLVSIIAKNSSAKNITFSLNKYLSGGEELPSGIDLSKAMITGHHNIENLIAAVLAGDVAGCSVRAMQEVIESFTGLKHRNQFVKEVNGVRYFDDSKGTNVGAVVKSLEGFDSKVVLIAGGLDKGGSYDPLRPLVKDKVKALVLIGAAKEIIAKALGDLTEVVMAENMADAVKEASKRAVKGDVVLLSPMCASMDMFRDYAHRGDVFANEVKKL